jgi:hypothetical protein
LSLNKKAETVLVFVFFSHGQCYAVEVYLHGRGCAGAVPGASSREQCRSFAEDAQELYSPAFVTLHPRFIPVYQLAEGLKKTPFFVRLRNTCHFPFR